MARRSLGSGRRTVQIYGPFVLHDLHCIYKFDLSSNGARHGGTLVYSLSIPITQISAMSILRSYVPYVLETRA